MARKRVEFRNFLDLQSRLVLLPRIEEEGVGAIVAAFRKGGLTQDGFENDVSNTDNGDADGEEKKQEPEAEEENLKEQQQEENESDLLGKALIAIQDCKQFECFNNATRDESIETQEHLVEVLDDNFADILAQIREMDQVALIFDNLPPHEPKNLCCFDPTLTIEEQEEVQEDQSTGSVVETGLQDTNEEEPTRARPSTVTLGQQMMSRWSTWSSRIGAEVASSAKNYATAVTSASSTINQKNIRSDNDGDPSQDITHDYAIFIQQPDGTFQPLSQSKLTLSTSTVISVRQLSSSQPCPSTLLFQWYRSGICQGKEVWTPLREASHATYQPSATDVGHHLKCIVSCQHGSFEFGIETDGKVAADLSMFNAARQALARGAQFTGLIGCGNAEGRRFILQIHLSVNRDKVPSESTSSTIIYQCSSDDQTREPIHEGSLLDATAWSDPANPKRLDIIFPDGSLPTEESCLLYALMTDNTFQLQAPNRLTREALLLALGIANFRGKPAELDCTTVLYDHLPDISSHESSPPSIDTQSESSKMALELDSSREALKDCKEAKSKIIKQEKLIADLRRQLESAQNGQVQLRNQVGKLQDQLSQKDTEKKEAQINLRRAERRIETLDDSIRRLKSDHILHTTALDEKLVSLSEKISSLEKTNKALQNEKAVLSAAVDARESKLAKMSDLQSSLDTLSAKVARGEALKSELTDMSSRYDELCRDLLTVSESEKECREQLVNAQVKMEDLCSKMETEQKKREVCQSELAQMTFKMQTVRSERNSFKQKADSLTREVNRLCRNGRTIRDIQRILADEDARKVEVEILRKQKREALEDLHQYRTAYQQQLVSHLMAGKDGEAAKAVERKVELERVVTDLTEYVTAKEMQLETMKQVNVALTEELRLLAKANMSRDEV